MNKATLAPEVARGMIKSLTVRLEIAETALRNTQTRVDSIKADIISLQNVCPHGEYEKPLGRVDQFHTCTICGAMIEVKF